MYGQQTKRFHQQFQYIHVWSQPKVIVNVPAITQATMLHIFYGCIWDGQQNS